MNDDLLSRGGDKKTESITVKISEDAYRFVQRRAEQLRFDSVGEYVRALVFADKEKAVHDFNLIAESLGVKGFSGNLVSDNLIHVPLNNQHA